jgi:TolB-like protein/Flp pilus assembly protein TadD
MHLVLQGGERLGPYEVIARLAAGGMGEVWRARDTRLGRDVAIKVLPDGLADDHGRLRRFEQEAQAAGRLNHPNILAIFDVGSHQGAPYIVLELLDGETLRERLTVGRIPLQKAVDYATQIARGLAAAHEKGIVHRDLKPGNLFITRDELVKILDFGVAKLADSPMLLAENPEAPTLDQPTIAGTILGTVGYMSPEQALGQPVDLRADIFSFGAVLFEMLAGRRAFSGTTPLEALFAILKDEPPALGRIVERCLAKRPEERYQSARELVSDLQSLEPVSETTRVAAGAALRTTPKRIMLAVLPFENLGHDPEQEYFSDGLMEETIADLGGVASDRLGVIARTSAMRYKGSRMSIAEIGRELGVDFAVEGSVRRRADLVRISVKLIRTSDQTQVWGKQYDRELKDFLAVQEELGRSIAEQVGVKLAPRDPAERRSIPTLNQAAYDAYLHGRFHLWRVTRSSLERAIEYFHRAIEIDPRMAVAFAGLAQAHVILPVAADTAPRQAFPEAERAAMQALALAPDCAEAHAAVGSLRFWHDWNWQASEAHCRQAIAVNPSYSRAHQALGRTLTNIGRFDQAIAEIDIARQLDPFAPLINALAVDFHFQARRHDEVPALIRRASEIDPNFWVTHVVAARVLLHQGRHDEALAEAQKAHELSGGHSEPLSLIGCTYGLMGREREAEAVLSQLQRLDAERYVPASSTAVVYLGLGDTEQVFGWLERAYRERDVHLLELGVEPKWDGLRHDPRFEDLIRRIGFSTR